MARTKTQRLEKYKKKIASLTGEIFHDEFMCMSDSYKESLIDQSVDCLFRLKFTLQGGGK